jgi:hypothetical protein
VTSATPTCTGTRDSHGNEVHPAPLPSSPEAFEPHDHAVPSPRTAYPFSAPPAMPVTPVSVDTRTGTRDRHGVLELHAWPLPSCPDPL